MSDKKITDLTAITTPATGDVFVLVDISDTTASAEGTNKRITFGNLTSSFATLDGTETFTNKTLTSPIINTPALGAGSVDAITEIASAIKSGVDATLITGTKGTSGDLSQWNADGDLVDGPTPPSGTIVGTTDTQTLTNKTYQNAAFSGDANITSGSGNITVAGIDPWRTITLTPGFLKPTTTAGCSDSTQIEAATNDIDYDYLAFDTSTDENAYCNFQMPESYDGGAIQFRYVWTNATGLTTETVVLELSGRSYGDDEAIDQAVGTPVEVSDTWLAQNDIHVSGWSGDVTLAGTPAASEWVHLEIMRDVSEDNMTGDLRLLALQIRYKAGQFGD